MKESVASRILKPFRLSARGVKQGRYLCEVCEKILALSDTKDSQKLDIGLPREVKRRGRSCALCRLINGARHCTPLHVEGEPIYIAWSKERGFHFPPFADDAYRLVFIDPGPTDEGNASAHTTGRIIQSKLEPTNVVNWVKTCDEHHGPACSPYENIIRSPTCTNGLKLLRVIDVQQRCLVEASPGCRYLALSYVWGQGRAVMLRTANRMQLSAPGGLESVRHQLPRTISDAITLVLAIGERYLWIDSLCLVQDDETDKLDGIQKMDLIYQGAILTIVAASGEDSDAGLPGLHLSSRKLTQLVAEIKPGVRLATTNPFYSALSGVKYMSRGWTFQEFVLSPRCLVFLPDQVYFVCRHGVWSEDTQYERFPYEVNRGIGSSQRIDRPSNTDPNPYGTYINMLIRYCVRDLTYESDTLHAMTGILNQICRRLKSGHLWGLPTVCFDLSVLHWHYDANPNGRRRAQFPSWSWCGWTNLHTGLVPWFTMDQDGESWLQNETYITWYKREPSGMLESVWDPLSNPEQGRPAEAEMGHSTRQPSTKFFPKCAVSVIPQLYPTTPTRDAFLDRSKRPYPVLQFWAHTITVSLCMDTEDRGAPAGSLPRARLAAVSHNRHSHRYCGAMLVDDNNIAAGLSIPTTHEAIILSSSSSGSSVGPFLPNYTDGPCYWIMLISWGGDVAERTGLGFILQECVDLASPNVVWREVAIA